MRNQPYTPNIHKIFQVLGVRADKKEQKVAVACVKREATATFYFSATFSILSPFEIAYLTVYAEPPVSFVR